MQKALKRLEIAGLASAFRLLFRPFQGFRGYLKGFWLLREYNANTFEGIPNFEGYILSGYASFSEKLKCFEVLCRKWQKKPRMFGYIAGYKQQ